MAAARVVLSPLLVVIHSLASPSRRQAGLRGLAVRRESGERKVEIPMLGPMPWSGVSSFLEEGKLSAEART